MDYAGKRNTENIKFVLYTRKRYNNNKNTVKYGSIKKYNQLMPINSNTSSSSNNNNVRKKNKKKKTK